MKFLRALTTLADRITAAMDRRREVKREAREAEHERRMRRKEVVRIPVGRREYGWADRRNTLDYFYRANRP